MQKKHSIMTALPTKNYIAKSCNLFLFFITAIISFLIFYGTHIFFGGNIYLIISLFLLHSYVLAVLFIKCVVFNTDYIVITHLCRFFFRSKTIHIEDIKKVHFSITRHGPNEWHIYLNNKRMPLILSTSKMLSISEEEKIMLVFIARGIPFKSNHSSCNKLFLKILEENQ